MILVCAPMMVIGIGVEMGFISEGVVLPMMLLLIIACLLLVVSTWGVMIWLIVKTIKSPSLEVGLKIVWCFLLYLFNVIAYPIYWFAYIRNE